MKITQDNNFCRVFELPDKYPEGFCFNGGKEVTFKMVDWFTPMPTPELLEDGGYSDVWEENIPAIIEFISTKMFVNTTKTYVLITDFGKSLVFNSKGEL